MFYGWKWRRRISRNKKPSQMMLFRNATEYQNTLSRLQYSIYIIIYPIHTTSSGFNLKDSKQQLQILNNILQTISIKCARWISTHKNHHHHHHSSQLLKGLKQSPQFLCFWQQIYFFSTSSSFLSLHFFLIFFSFLSFHTQSVNFSKWKWKKKKKQQQQMKGEKCLFSDNGWLMGVVSYTEWQFP